MLAIGLMSGTSLDGVDAALVEINEIANSFKLINFITLNYDKGFKEKLMRNLSVDSARLDEVCSLNFEISEKFVLAIDEVLRNTKYKYDDISFVASHGQTIWHSPKYIDGNIPSTLQIGEASVISLKTGITVINNFRCADIVAQGEGAPLVPMAEFILFKDKDKDIVLQNIGGISNLTYLSKKATLDDVIAFDCGPGNVMIDYFVSKYFNIPFDTSGKIAKSGKVINEIFDYLKRDPFILKAPPKSTGREYYSKKNFETLEKKLSFEKYKKEDIITTITYFTAYAISYNYKKYLPNIDRVIVSGGGSHNQYIIDSLKEDLKVEILTLEDLGLSSDAKEALAFCVLGYLTYNKKTGNVKKATGAKEDVVLGSITYAKKRI